ncbi:MAG: hypothetical protein AAGE01_25210 [Pseudomonadota bacterium]
MNATDAPDTDRMQWIMLIGLLVGIFGFCANEICEQLGVTGGWSIAASVVTLIGFLGFAAGLVGMRQPSGEVLTSVIDDERISFLRSHAYAYAFGAIIVLQVTMLLFGDGLARLTGIELGMGFAAMLTLLVGLATALGRFMVLNR